MNSISTNIVHENQGAYLAELLMVNENPSLANTPYFWQSPNYRARFLNRVFSVNKRLPYAGFDILEKVIIKNKLTQLNKDADLLIANEIGQTK